MNKNLNHYQANLFIINKPTNIFSINRMIGLNIMNYTIHDIQW